MKGQVKFFNDEKGYGFIKPDDGSKDVFVHKSGLIDRIQDEDIVTFEVQDGPKGPSAVDVRRAD